LDVRSAALNHMDIRVRKGRPGLKVDMPHILGSDAAGETVLAEAEYAGECMSGTCVFYKRAKYLRGQ